MSETANPYAPPKAVVADLTRSGSEAEHVRQEHIKHEASIRSVGVLYYLGGGLMVLGAMGLFAVGLGGQGALGYGFGALYLALGGLSLVLGRGIRAYRPWARTTGIVLACIGLLGFPVGTLINAYILYLLLSQKGRRIFASDYPDIVAATPHIEYKTSVVVWIVLGVLVLAFVGLIVAAILNR